jgi:hypothetical protein
MVFPEEKRSFIEELQSLDESTKQKVLVIATAVIMVVVLYFWFADFNNIVSNASGGASLQNGSSTVENASASEGFSQMAQDGAGTIFQSFKNGIESIGGFVKSPKQYEVSPK